MRTVMQPAEINGPNDSQDSHGAGNRSQSQQLQWDDILPQAAGRVLRKAPPQQGLTRVLHDQSPVWTGGSVKNVSPLRAPVTAEARPGWSARGRAMCRPSAHSLSALCVQPALPACGLSACCPLA